MESLQQLTRRQLQALAIIQKLETREKGASLRSVASEMKIRPPSALDHVGALEKLGLVTRYRGKTRLTPSGQECLVDYLRHHRLAERLFSNLGLSPDDCCKAASEVDIAISHKTIERLCRAEGHPPLCPHGEPIPPCSSKGNK
jgi:DtxR family Mn-dependent transcriptional regulator